MPSFVQNMGIDHSRADVLVTEQFLNRADIVARLKQMRGEGVPEGVAAGMLNYPGLADRFLDGPLKNRLMNVMPSLFTGLLVPPAVFLWEDPLPAPVSGGIGILALLGVGHLNTAPALGQVLLVNPFDLLEVFLERGLERFGQHRYAILCAIAVAGKDLVAGEVYVLRSEAEAFHQAKTCAIVQRGHEPLLAGQIHQHRFHILPRHDHWKARGLARADELAQLAHFATNHMAIQE